MIAAERTGANMRERDGFSRRELIWLSAGGAVAAATLAASRKAKAQAVAAQPRANAARAGGGATKAGLSKPRLERMRQVLSGYVERGEVPGLVALVWRRGELHCEVLGVRTAGEKAAMTRDTIFRVSSMSKPVTALATLILIEECKLRLDEPIDRIVPE